MSFLQKKNCFAAKKCHIVLFSPHQVVKHACLVYFSLKIGIERAINLLFPYRVYKNLKVTVKTSPSETKNYDILKSSSLISDDADFLRKAILKRKEELKDSIFLL